MANPLFPPTSDPIARPRANKGQISEDSKRTIAAYDWSVDDAWLRWFTVGSQAAVLTPVQVVPPISLTNKAASISTTSIAPITAGGLYRVTYYASINKAAGVSSSLTVTFTWTDHTRAMSFSGAAITGNTVFTYQTGTLLVYADAPVPITYSTTYASNPASVMEYELYVTLERMG